MTYDTAGALRMALEARLRRHALRAGARLDRLRRRVLLERIVARLESAEPRAWVLKGGMALDARLRDDARLTKDIDFGLRGEVVEAGDLRDRLADALGADPDGDRFVVVPGLPRPLHQADDGHRIWRVRVEVSLADRRFGEIQVDVSARAHELDRTDRVTLGNSLAFAGIPAPQVDVVDIHRHAAEKFRGMLRTFDGRENTRVRDLVDLVILVEHGLLDPFALAEATKRVWREQAGVEPPRELPLLPAFWPERYEELAAEQNLSTLSFSAASALVSRLWAEIHAC